MASPTIIGDFDDYLLTEAGWQSPYTTTTPDAPKPRRSGAPLPSPGDSARQEYGIPMNRWVALPEEERQAIITKFERAKRMKSRFGGDNPMPKPTAETPVSGRLDGDIEGSVLRRGDEGWYVVNKYGEKMPVNDDKPYATEEQAIESARQLAHRATESAGLGIKTRTVKDGPRAGMEVRSGVKKYNRAVRRLGLHAKFMPKVEVEAGDRLDTPGYVVVDPEGKVVRGPMPSQEHAQILADKLGEGHSVQPNKLDQAKEKKPLPPAVTPTTNNTQGYYVVHDQHPEVRLAGPFTTDAEAERAVNEIGDKIAQQEIDDRGLIGHSVDRAREAARNDLSYTYYNKDAKEGEAGWITSDAKKAQDAGKLGIGGIDKTTHNQKRWNMGDLRGAQLKLFEDGMIGRPAQDGSRTAPKDLNSDLGYQRGRLDNLKHVFCPLILDKANPPSEPWTVEQVFMGMKPILNQLVRKWSGQGFDEAEALGPAMVGLMQAMENDKGLSPFAKYAEQYINNQMSKAKKKGGSVGRSLRDKGWMSGGITSLDTPLGTGEEGEGTVGSTVEAGREKHDAMRCPTCKGAGFDPDDEGVTCSQCRGSGKHGSDRKGNPKGCSRCGGSGRVYHECPTCDGEGEIAASVETGGGHNDRSEGGLVIDPKTGDMKLADGKVDAGDDPLNPGEKRNEAMSKRLNDAARLIYLLMNEAQLTEDQRLVLGLAFGLDGLSDGSSRTSGKVRGPTEVGKLMGAIKERPPLAAVGIGKALRGAVKRLRAVLRRKTEGGFDKATGELKKPGDNSKMELFDWFLEYQKEYKLQDLAKTDPIDLDEKGRPKHSDDKEAGGWALGPRGQIAPPPWNAGMSKGGRARTQEEQEAMDLLDNPWYRRPIEDYTPAEHLKAIHDMLDLDIIPAHLESEWLEREGVGSWDQIAPDKLITYHRLLSKELDKAVRPNYRNDNDENTSYWSDKEGNPLEAGYERMDRYEAAKREKFAEKQAEWIAAGEKGPVPALSKAELEEIRNELGSSQSYDPVTRKPVATGDAVRRQAKQLAIKLGLDYRKIEGTGDNGMITVDDVKTAAAARDAAAPKRPEVPDDFEADDVSIPVRKIHEDPAMAEAVWQHFNGLLNLMESIFDNCVCEEVSAGILGVEALDLID